MTAFAAGQSGISKEFRMNLERKPKNAGRNVTSAEGRTKAFVIDELDLGKETVLDLTDEQAQWVKGGQPCSRNGSGCASG